METEKNILPPPPGLVASFTAGFENVANHIYLILPPLLLDVFLWFGPHLRLKALFAPWVADFITLAQSNAQILPAEVNIQDTFSQLFDTFNLFSVLRTFPVGVASLLQGQSPLQTPWGEAAIIETPSYLLLAGWLALLVFVGWVAGGLYFHWVAGVSLGFKRGEPARSALHSIKQTILLSIIWLVLLVVFGTPVFLIFSVLAFLSPFLAQAVIFLFALFSLWVILPVFFSPHGIFTYQHSAFQAILNSLQMTRLTLSNSSMFLVGFFIISLGLNLLWRTPPEASWLTLLGIAGHAFVSTGLLASSFIYYREINAWMQAMIERLKLKATSAQA